MKRISMVPSLLGLALGLATMVGLSFVNAAEVGARKEDEAAIRAASQVIAEAFQKGDAKAFAASFTDEGEFVGDDDQVIKGREEIEKAYAKFFTSRKELQAASQTNSIRFLGNDTAIEEGTFSVEAKGSPASSSRFSSVFVRQSGKWLVAHLKEWQSAESSSSSLQDLAWLIGTWQSEGKDSKASTTYAWSESKKYIQAKYTVTVDGETSSGTQVFAVDPGTGLIRVWTFGSDGSLGEAVWTWDGDRWVIDSLGTTAEGLSTTATNLLKRTEEGFTWRSVNRTLNDEALEDLAAVKVKSVKSEK